MRPPTAEALARPQAGVEGFSFVKRDLVRLLGIIVLDDKGAQDRVRECGGIPVVMNLCVIDDRNPCTSSTLRTRRSAEVWVCRHEGACDPGVAEPSAWEPDESRHCEGDTARRTLG